MRLDETMALWPTNNYINIVNGRRANRNRGYRIGECYGPSEIDIDRLQDQGNTLASKHRLYALLPTKCVS